MNSNSKSESQLPSSPGPANPRSELPFKTRAWEFWRRNQLVFVHLPLLLLFMFTTYVVLKSIDPRIGVEGFGDLFGYTLNGVRAVFILFTAWWMKKWMWFDLHDKTELELFTTMRKGSSAEARWAFWIVAKDRVEWVLALALTTFWYTR